MPAWEAREGHVLLRVRVQPRASKNSLKVEDDGRIKVHLTAPPIEGEANKALCQFLAALLNVPKSSVKVVAGEKSREKTLRVEGVNVEAVEHALA